MLPTAAIWKEEDIWKSKSRYRDPWCLVANEAVQRFWSKELLLQRASVHTLLGAGRVDPFRSYPIDANRDDHQLVDYCKNMPLFSIISCIER